MYKKVSQKKAPLHEELKKKGFKMAQNKAHKGWVPKPSGNFKKKKAVKTAAKKKKAIKKTSQFITTNSKKIYIQSVSYMYSREHAMRLLADVV